jgi:hypothetical protein
MAARPKIIIQHCIKSHFFNEVIKLPASVKIIAINFEVGFAIKRMSQVIPQSMADAGVTYICKSDPSIEINGRLTGTRARMKLDILSICKDAGLNPNTVRVKRMEVATGLRDKHQGVFHRMTKKLAGPDDKVERHVVLGLIKWDGDESVIAQACSTKKYKCKFDTQMIRTVLCEEG